MSVEEFAPLRLGLLGLSPHSRSILDAARRSERVVVTAVSARDQETLRSWGADRALGADLATYDTYNDLLRDEAIDAVYIGLPTAQHAAWCCAAARMHKHVLVEKPLAAETVEALRMRQCCEEEGVVLMDASAFPHGERMKQMQDECLDRDVFGAVSRVDAAFTFHGSDAFLRGAGGEAAELDPLGCLGDLGWYCVRAGLLAFGPDCAPRAAACVVAEENGAGVPLDATCAVYFEGGRALHFHCSYLHPFQQRLAIVGDKKVLTCDDFVIPRFAKDCGYTVESFVQGASPLIDLDTAVVSAKHETRVQNSVGQRLMLLNWFADLCLLEQVDRDESRRLEAEAALYAQAAVSCLVESAAAGGQKLQIDLALEAPQALVEVDADAPAAKRKRFD